jgi:hypothetical protein
MNFPTQGKNVWVRDGKKKDKKPGENSGFEFRTAYC